MTNRAQVHKPFTLDIFTQLQPGQLATFTDQGAPANFYKVTPDVTGNPVLIAANEFPIYFKYYIQATIF